MSFMQDREIAASGEHIRHLEERLHDLQQKLSGFAQQSPYGRLIEIFQKPGWTTVAEARVFEAALDSLDTQLDMLKRDQQNLMKAAALVSNAA